MIPVMIVPVLRFYEKLQSMIDSIDWPIGHLIIIDNGGRLGSLSAPTVERVSIVTMPENIGVPTAWNLGIQIEPFAPYWLMSQDDVIWTAGGLERVEAESGPDVLTLDMKGRRPFSSFTVGSSVVEKVGMFDESYFPLGGDDTNYHKRCHRYQIEERDISGTFVAENSATIKHLVSSRSASGAVILLNMNRALTSPVENEGWTLARRRRNGKTNTTPELTTKVLNMLDGEYQVHDAFESSWFRVSMPPL